jgi:diacylglycerol kinase (ATP)
LIQVTKDLSAGVVLLASICAALIGYIILWPALDLNKIASGVIKIREVPDLVVFGSLLLVGIVTIIIKIFSGKGTPMYGGMPSGHAAVAFSLWTSITFLTNQPIIVLLGFILAVLVTQNRLRSGIHTLWEALGGAILGTFLTTLIFKVCR